MICSDSYYCHPNIRYPPPPIMQRCMCAELSCFVHFSTDSQIWAKCKIKECRLDLSISVVVRKNAISARLKTVVKMEYHKTKILDDWKSEKYSRRTSELENHGCHPLTGNFIPLTTSLGILTIFCGIFLFTKFDLIVLVQQLCGACGSVKCS